MRYWLAYDISQGHLGLNSKGRRPKTTHPRRMMCKYRYTRFDPKSTHFFFGDFESR
jgi:hypothetical protein